MYFCGRYTHLSSLKVYSVRAHLFALSSYNGFNFSQIQDEYISITDAVSKTRLAKSKDNLSGSGQTLILANIVKEDGVWTVNLVNKITAHTCSEYLRTKGDF